MSAPHEKVSWPMLVLIVSVLGGGGAVVWNARSYVDGEVRAHAAQPAAHPGGASAELLRETREDVAELRKAVAGIDKTVSGIAATLAALDSDEARLSRVAGMVRARPASRSATAVRGTGRAAP